LTHTPTEAQFYVLDFGGGGFPALRDLPHVGGVSTRLEVSQVRRTVAEVLTVLVARERLFAERGIDSMDTYRRLRSSGRVTDDPFGDVFLIVDGWATLRSDFEDLEPTLTEIAARGLTYGVHLLVGAGRWSELRPGVRDMLGGRLELRLGDPSDSMLDRRTAMNVPEQSPGRGITGDRYHFLAALPRLDGVQTMDDLGDGLAKLVTEIAGQWHGPAAPRVRLLPQTHPYHQLPLQDPRPGIPIGIAEADLEPVFLDLVGEPHVLAYGDGESGKSSFLRAFAQAVVDRYAPDEARIVLVDYRRSLLGAVGPSHLIGYGSTAQRAEEILAEIAQVMQARLPGPDVTPEQLRDRSWWRGPQLFVLVDDYDLVAGSSSNPVALLRDHLAQARDIGLHLVLARRSGGAGRALYEPVTMALRDLGSPGIVLSGDREEGPLVGNVRPSAQPPGRGWLVTRRDGVRLVQLAWLEPS
jgi:S-DNA-T family DNA segregation ATPase FtsK/SpoIIIE